MVSIECIDGSGVSCLDKLMESIKTAYHECDDTIDGYMLKEDIGYNRRITLTYSHGNDGVHVTSIPFKLYLKLDAYAKIASIREEIDAELLERNQAIHLEDSSCGWELGDDLMIKINKNTGTVEIRQYRTCPRGLRREGEGIIMCPVEWLFFNATYKKICVMVPQVIEMKHCIDNHLMFDGSPTCSI